MTQTIDAEAQELIRGLAEQPCPSWVHSQTTYGSDCRDCQGTGLAFPWASEECPPCYVCPEHGRKATVDEDGCCVTCGADAPECSDGRVPKDVRLEEVLPMLCEPGKGLVIQQFFDGTWRIRLSDGETPLLAALRAVVGSFIHSREESRR